MKDSAYPYSQPKISLITPSYNQGQYLEETINSIISQKYDNYELIIIDGGSTDSTLDVIKRYESYITYWVSEPDRGQSHAIQKGLARATGDIINWINSDDLLAPGALHHIAAEFNLDTHDVLCGYCDYFVDDLGHMDLHNERMGLHATVGETMLGQKINQPSTFFKASVMKELGVDEQFHFTMDLDLWYRYLLRAGQSRVKMSESLFTYFRLHKASKSVALTPQFEGDIRKVFYNIMYSLDQSATLLKFMRVGINEAAFKPTRYLVGVSAEEMRVFVQQQAWRGVQYFNNMNDFAAARECFAIARQHGQPLSMTVARQFIKHYTVPQRLLHWLARRA